VEHIEVLMFCQTTVTAQMLITVRDRNCIHNITDIYGY